MNDIAAPSHNPTRPIQQRLVTRRYHRFLLVGVINACVDIGTLNGFMLLWPTHSFVQLLTYNTIAVLCTLATSYLLNRRWTFADQANSSRRQTWLFWIQGAANIVINDLILAIFSHEVFAHLTESTLINSDLSKGISMFTSSSISYMMLRLLVFRAT
ncbi:MAG: GtrA family protein [Acidibacillus sp.]|nr:GtrA family protein [Acidibacillus sp.]